MWNKIQTCKVSPLRRKKGLYANFFQDVEFFDDDDKKLDNEFLKRSKTSHH